MPNDFEMNSQTRPAAQHKRKLKVKQNNQIRPFGTKEKKSTKIDNLKHQFYHCKNITYKTRLKYSIWNYYTEGIYITYYKACRSVHSSFLILWLRHRGIFSLWIKHSRFASNTSQPN